jgi:hypothetical protein
MRVDYRLLTLMTLNLKVPSEVIIRGNFPTIFLFYISYCRFRFGDKRNHLVTNRIGQ